MILPSTARNPLKGLLLGGAALALAACGGADDTETTYEVDATDQSGGELIVETPVPGAVDVELPETPMTPVAPGPATATSTATPAPTASPAP